MSLKPFSHSTKALLVSATLLIADTTPLLTPAAYGQGITTGSIIGIAVDPSGAVISGATVTAISKDRGIQTKETTGSNGSFSFRNVTGGTYTVTVEASGFEVTKIQNVRVDAGQINDLGSTKLGLGAASTSVEVSESSAPLLETTESQISTTFSSLQTEDLPLNGAIDNIALFTPGVAIGHDDSFSNSNGNNLSINGNRSRSNNYEIDGQSNNDNSVGGPQIFFANQDALQDVQIITSNFSAQYGRNMGGVINYVTKSGSNRFHGSGYEFFTGDFLQSRNNAEIVAGIKAPPRYVDNRYGGTFGGPILKDKIWFFGGTNFEHRRQGFNPLNPSNPTPTPQGIQQLQAAFPGNPAVADLVASGPYTLQATQPANKAPVVQTTVTGPNGQTVIIPFQKVTIPVAPSYNDQEDLGRLDWQATEKDHFFIRYLYQNTLSGGSQLSNGYVYTVPDATHSIGADWAHTFSSAWVNQLRYSFQQSKLFFQGGTQPNCVSTSLSSCTTSVGISGSLGYGYATNLPQGRTVKVTQVQDNANWTHGAHSVSFGGDFTEQNSPNVFLPNYNGGFSYSSFSNYLQDVGTLTIGDGSPVIPFKEPDFGLYIQDDWKVAPSLTLNLGFRYEFFDQAVNTLNAETIAHETGPNPFWDKTLPLAARVYPYTNRNWKNLQPRLGFAFNPASFKRLVIHGAYGIQYDPAFYNIFLNSATAAPVINIGTVTCAGNCLPNGSSGASVRALDLPKIPTGVNPTSRNYTNNPSTFVNPRGQTYNLGVQYDIHAAVLGISYVGNHVSRQFQSINGNPYLLPIAQAFPNVVAPSSLCSTPGAIGLGRLNCNQANVTTRNNNGFSNYNSLQVQVQTRNYHGATASVSYTFSRAIDNSDEVYGASSPAGTLTSIPFAQNPLQTDIPERAVANYSYPNLASVAINYVVPGFSKQSGLFGRLLGGYEVAPAWVFNNGESFTPYQYYTATTFTDKTSNAVANTSSYCDPKFDARNGYDVCRPVLANARAPLTAIGIYVQDPTRAISTAGTGFYNYQSVAGGKLNQPISINQAHWLYNNKSYANLVGNPYPGSPRNITRGQGYNNLDASIIKNTNIREGIDLKLYLLGFNVLNHSFVGNPDTFIEDAAFGTTIANQGNQRSFQIGGKVLF